MSGLPGWPDGPSEFGTVPWASDPEGWDPETGMPGILATGRAIQIWMVLVAGSDPVWVPRIASTFCLPADRIREAVVEHPFLALTADGMTVLHDPSGGDDLGAEEAPGMPVAEP